MYVFKAKKICSIGPWSSHLNVDSLLASLPTGTQKIIQASKRLTIIWQISSSSPTKLRLLSRVVPNNAWD